jgi:menaquinol-cytochrome c reductase iron-sulfur subunit
LGQIEILGVQLATERAAGAVCGDKNCIRISFHWAAISNLDDLTTMLRERSTRRSFHIAIIHSCGALIAAALAIPAAFYLLIKPKNQDADWLEIADLKQLGMDAPEQILFDRRRTDGWRKVVEKAATWVVRTNDNKVVAFTPFCTHLGCAYHWESANKSFVCPCHMSAFALDGKVLNGPAARPLDRYACRVEAGKILIGSQVERSDA